MIFFFYRVLYLVLFLVLQTLRPFLSGKLRLFIEEKNLAVFRNPKNQESQRPIWIHASSGEIEYAKPLIRELKSKFPNTQILVTFNSPSAISLIEKNELIDFWGPLPWDLSWEVSTFVQRWRPKALLIARTDAWPQTVDICKKNQIPVHLFSATFAENSSRLRGVAKALTFNTLKKIDSIACVSDSDVQNLRQRGYTQQNLTVNGDTRYDQVFFRLAHPKTLNESIRPQRNTLILGSTWHEDEQTLIPSIAPLLQKGLQIIIAPHETSEAHLSQLELFLTSQGGHIQIERYSKAQSSNWDILIIDQIGILAELYTWSQLAFIGGSFKAQVHSVMEALAAGLPVAVGPLHKNNREALEFKQIALNQKYFIVSEIKQSHDLISWADSLLPEINNHHKNVSFLIHQKQGATLRTLSQLPDNFFQPT